MAAAHFNWIVRAALQWNILPEPEHIAEISANVKRADDIHGWSNGTIKLLEFLTINLKHSQVQRGSLLEILLAGGTLTWNEDNKSAELMEFLAQISEAFALLEDKPSAWDKLQLSGLA